MIQLWIETTNVVIKVWFMNKAEHIAAHKSEQIKANREDF